MTPQAARELIQRNEVDVVDVREPNEWLGGKAAGVRRETAARLAVQNGLTRV